MQRLFVEPDVFHAIAVANAVDHGEEPFDIGSACRSPHADRRCAIRAKFFLTVKPLTLLDQFLNDAA
jgi:hypothetical protein